MVTVGNIYHMFYEGDRRRRRLGKVSFNVANQIGHAISADGIHWTKDTRNPVFSGLPGSPEPQVFSPTVIHRDGKVCTFYYAGTQVFSLYLAVLDDGVHWTRLGQLLKPTPGTWDQYGVSDVAVLHDGTRFLM